MNTGGVNDNFTTKTWYVKAVDLALEWNYEYNSFSYIRGDTFTLKWKSYGGVNCTAHIVFDDIYNPGVTYFTKDHMATGVGETVSDPMPSLSYGPHKCEIYLTTEVNGQTYRTESIVNEITFVKDSTSTILTVPYYET